MARPRSELQTILQEIAGYGNHVYFQPPESVKIKYPCIVYEYSNEEVNYASDTRYNEKMLYMVTVIDEDPDSNIPNRLKKLPYTSFESYFVSDNLHHFVFDLYY